MCGIFKERTCCCKNDLVCLHLVTITTCKCYIVKSWSSLRSKNEALTFPSKSFHLTKNFSEFDIFGQMEVHWQKSPKSGEKPIQMIQIYLSFVLPVPMIFRSGNISLGALRWFFKAQIILLYLTVRDCPINSFVNHLFINYAQVFVNIFTTPFHYWNSYLFLLVRQPFGCAWSVLQFIQCLRNRMFI